jgi:carboxyl-terminal processing protease
MLGKRAKNGIKVAVLCIAVSLLSFILGTKTADTQPFYAFNKSEKSSEVSQQDLLKVEKLRPIIDVMNLIESKFIREVDTSQLVDGAIRGMVSSLKDQYSVYMNSSEFEDFIISINGSFEGVGISIGADEKTGDIIVVSPIEGAPAHRAGILPKDKIIKVDETDIRGKSVDEAVKLLRGEKGTKVVIQIERAGIKQPLKYELIRESIRLKTVKQEVVDDGIGYIKITSFDTHTADEFEDAINVLKKQGIQGLVIDLRNNPGGSLHESVKVADQILGEGLIVYTVDRNDKKLEEYYSDAKKLSLPLVVLINENSASAAEIVAGAVQDHDAGVLVGTKTFGKGSVQEVEPFENGSGLKLTIANYHIPSGRCIDGMGIEPNITVELDKGVNPLLIKRDNDKQLEKALQIVKSYDATGVIKR